MTIYIFTNHWLHCIFLSLESTSIVHLVLSDLIVHHCRLKPIYQWLQSAVDNFCEGELFIKGLVVLY